MVELVANALTTLESVKAMLGLADCCYIDIERDEVIIQMINAASAWFERQTGRKFGLDTYVEMHQGTNSQQLCLRQYPILAVESVTDVHGEIEVSAEEYSFEDYWNIGVLWKYDGWAQSAIRQGLAYDPLFTRRNLRIEYTAGYVLPNDATPENPVTLPADIEQLICEFAMQQYTLLKDGASNLSSFSISDVSWTFDKTYKQMWLDTVNSYKRWE
jgi:hypothetical protein